MASRDRPKALKSCIVVGFVVCLAAAFILANVFKSFSQTPKSSSPDRKIELSTKDLSPQVREMLLHLTSKNKTSKCWKKFKQPLRTGLNYDHFLSKEDKHYSKGVAFVSAEHYGQAIREFTQVLIINSRYADAYYNRGLVYAYQKHYDQALADFNKFISLASEDPDVYYNRALCYALQDRFDQALADLNKSIDLDPQDPQAYYLRGFVYCKQGQAAGARSDYQKALSLNPDWVKEAASGGKSELDNYALVLQGKAPKSSKAATEREEEAHKQQALTLARNAKYDQALAEINQALTQDPKDAETYNRRGGIYTLQGHYAQAIADFTKALELNPRYAKAYYNRALAYYYQGKYDQAISDLTKAIELIPKDVASYNNRGLAYMQKGNYERAIDDFNVATILKPKLADAYFNKAVSCEKAGRREEARKAYAAFIKYAPPGAKAQIEQAQKGASQ
jgi:tetratricopeptide (TPR) repeat protein